MKARIVPPTEIEIRRVADALRAGEVAGMPTETVYGLAGSLFIEDALARIFSTKERPVFDPLIAHVCVAEGPRLPQLEAMGLIDLGRMHVKQKDVAEKLLLRFWPGPLTLVLPKTPQVPDLATSGLPSVAVRMPRHPVAQALIRELGAPVAAPSANRFGRISPTTAEAVAHELGDRIDFILDGGPCEVGLESTILTFSPDGEAVLLRPGGVSTRDIETATGRPVRRPQATASESSPQAAPGMLESHYAPKKPLRLAPRPFRDLSDREFKTLFNESPAPWGVLFFSKESAQAATLRIDQLLGVPAASTRILALDGSVDTAARTLFASMRALDASAAQGLVAEPPPTEEGLGYAIWDRLKRASAR